MILWFIAGFLALIVIVCAIFAWFGYIFDKVTKEEG